MCALCVQDRGCTRFLPGSHCVVRRNLWDHDLLPHLRDAEEAHSWETTHVCQQRWRKKSLGLPKPHVRSCFCQRLCFLHSISTWYGTLLNLSVQHLHTLLIYTVKKVISAVQNKCLVYWLASDPCAVCYCTLSHFLHYFLMFKRFISAVIWHSVFLVSPPQRSFGQGWEKRVANINTFSKRPAWWRWRRAMLLFTEDSFHSSLGKFPTRL